MNRNCLLVAAFLASLVPVAASCATIASTSLADGTYTVQVVKVVDPKHVEVRMDTGADTTLASGRDNVDFSKVQVNDQLMLSLIKGSVVVFRDMTNH